LIGQGVQLEQDLVFKLPEPALIDGLDGKQQREIITRIAGRYGWQQFVRKSAVAPFMLKQAYLKDEQGRRVGHAVSLWFIAYGSLADLEDESLADDFAGPERSPASESDAEVRELSEDELSNFGLETIDKEVERYVVAEVPLFNRVQVRGVVHARQSRTVESITVGWELDARFSRDDRLANRWWPLETTELGERKRGTPRPYQGYGGYLKITTLAEPEGALLFETHVVFHEPVDWFRGSNFLRSKTPLLVRENVDKLRRRLARLKRSRSQAEQ
jgi:hypothetical protein